MTTGISQRLVLRISLIHFNLKSGYLIVGDIVKNLSGCVGGGFSFDESGDDDAQFEQHVHRPSQ